ADGGRSRGGGVPGTGGGWRVASGEKRRIASFFSRHSPPATRHSLTPRRLPLRLRRRPSQRPYRRRPAGRRCRRAPARRGRAVAGFVCWRRGYWRAGPEARLGLAWLAAATLVLSCAAFKRGDYLLPAYPGAALFLGSIFSNEERRWRDARPRAVWVGLCLLPC